MTGAHRRGRSRRGLAIYGISAVAALGAVVVSWHAGADAGPAAPTGTPHSALARGQPPKTPRSTSAVLAPLPNGPTGPAHAALPHAVSAAVPVRISIPSIGVASSLEQLALLPDGTLQPPARWDRAGWYADGPRPGDPGPAVIAGHVDSVSGPAVFYRLRQLRPGAVVVIRDGRGRSFRFAVDGVHSYPKDRFPADAVYGPVPLPVLRLVTCTGDFDYAQGSYLDNLVVSAHLAGD